MGTTTEYPFGFKLPQLPGRQLDQYGGLVGLQTSVGGIDPDLVAPSTLQWVVGVERHVVGNLIAGMNYSGSRSWDMVNGTDLNRFAGDFLDGKLDRLHPSFGQMFYEWNRNSIHYNGIILTLRGSAGRYGSFQASYTMARTTDYGQAGSRINRDGSFGYPDQHQLDLYKGDADWDIIRQIKAMVSIPVIGNGDVTNAGDAARLLALTGCDGVMIGRAALGQPWIFRQIEHELQTGETLPAPTQAERAAIALEHARRALANADGHETIVVRELRGQLSKYQLDEPGAVHIRNQIVRVETGDDIERLLLPLAETAIEAF
ncbi:hypothetical protein FBR01_08100 [Anaerolineae bacterium CFX8]|nr:hypothetical protein [Anaerolineae bacterium CFX8]